jgi:hypothetical protein
MDFYGNGNEHFSSIRPENTNFLKKEVRYSCIISVSIHWIMLHHIREGYKIHIWGYKNTRGPGFDSQLY